MYVYFHCTKLKKKYPVRPHSRHALEPDITSRVEIVYSHRLKEWHSPIALSTMLCNECQSNAVPGRGVNPSSRLGAQTRRESGMGPS